MVNQVSASPSACEDPGGRRCGSVQLGWMVAAFGATWTVVGCGPSEQTRFNPSPPAAEVTPGWRVHKGDGFHFFAPDDLKIPVDMSGIDMFGPPPAELKPIDPSTVGADIYLVDITSRATIGEQRTKLLVNHERRRTNLQMEVERLRGKVPQIYEDNPVEFPIGPGHEFVTMYQTIGGDQIHGIHIVLVNEQDVYVFRFIDTGTNLRIKQYARQVVETFRLGDPPAGALPAEIENPFKGLDLGSIFER